MSCRVCVHSVKWTPVYELLTPGLVWAQCKPPPVFWAVALWSCCLPCVLTGEASWAWTEASSAPLSSPWRSYTCTNTNTRRVYQCVAAVQWRQTLCFKTFTKLSLDQQESKGPPQHKHLLHASHSGWLRQHYGSHLIFITRFQAACNDAALDEISVLFYGILPFSCSQCEFISFDRWRRPIDSVHTEITRSPSADTLMQLLKLPA